MSSDDRGGFAGLYTAIAESLAPPGALRVADNIVIRRAGAIEPRQGFTPDGPTWNDAAITWHWTFPAITADIADAQMIVGSSGVYNRDSSSEVTYQDPIGSPIRPGRVRQDVWSFALSRNNTYMASSGGTLKLSDDAQSFVVSAPNLTVRLSPSLNVTAGFLALNFKCAYRSVLVYRDAGGLETRSRPSGAQIISNTTFATCSINVSVDVEPPLWPGLGDLYQVEIYRSRVFPIAATIDEEMSLVRAYDSVGIVGFNFDDLLTDSERGKALYTSPSRGGIGAENIGAPASALIELFKGSLVYANVVSRQSVGVSYTFSTSLSGSATGIGQRIYTGTSSVGSPVITGLSSTVGLEIGQKVSGSGAFPFIATIIDISGSTVTVEVNATSAVSGPFIFSDAIEINGVWVQAGPDDPGNGVLIGTQSVTSYNITPPVPPYTRTLVMESLIPGDPFTVRATHGSEYSPPLPDASEPAQGSAADEFPNGIYVSLQDQPEHITEASFFQIAAKSKHILGCVATRDALFVIKEEGIWRVAGIQSDLRVDAFDLTTFCILPSSIQSLDGRIYMLSQRGVVTIDESGVQVISEPIHDQVALMVDDCKANFSNLGYYKLSGVDGVASAVDVRNGEYILLCGTTVKDIGGNALVFNSRSGSWTTFSFNPSGAAGFVASGMGLNAARDPIVCHVGGLRVSDNTVESLDGERMYRHYDDVATVDPNGFGLIDGDTRAQLFFPYTVSAVTGDVYKDSNGVFYHISSQIASTDIAIDLVQDGVGPGLGAGSIYRPITATIQPCGFSQTRQLNKLWMKISWIFSSFVGPTKVEGLFTSSGPLEPEVQQATVQEPAFVGPSGFAAHHEGVLLQSDIPRAHARSWMMRVALRMVIAIGRVSLESIGVDARDNVPNRNLQASTGTQ